MVPRVRAAVRPWPSGLLRHAAAPDDPARRRHQDRGVPALRVPPPLVAVRLGARHVERSPRGRRRLRRRRPDRVSPVAGAQRPLAALDCGDGPADHARARRGRPPAHAHAHGTAPFGRLRDAGQGGHRRRRRRRGTPDRAGDAALAHAPLHADRIRRRRPRQAELPDPRRPRPRHDGGVAAHRP